MEINKKNRYYFRIKPASRTAGLSIAIVMNYLKDKL